MKKKLYQSVGKCGHTNDFCKKRSIGELPSGHFPHRKQTANYFSVSIFNCALIKDMQKYKCFIIKLKSKQFSSKRDQACIFK